MNDKYPVSPGGGLHTSSRSYFATGTIKVADTHCDKSINRTNTPGFATTSRIYKVCLFSHHPVKLEHQQILKTHFIEKNAIMHFLRLLLFFFVLLAPLQLATASKFKQCSRGPIRIGSTAASCRNCCIKCLKSLDGSGVTYTPNGCRKYCNNWRYC